MIHNLTRDTSAPSADLLAEWSPVGDTDKAPGAVECLSITDGHSAHDRSRADFLREIQSLGSGRRSQPANSDILPVHVSCPYETWTNVFGEPESVIEYHEVPTRLAVQVWKHPCADGPVSCVGHIYEHPSGSKWVIAFRLGFLPAGADDGGGPTLLGDGCVGPSPSVLQRAKQSFGRRLRAIAEESGDKELVATCAASFSFLPLHVSCSYEAWVREFGEPQSLVEYRNASTGLTLSVWKQDCPVGLVTCIGHIFERSHSGRWLVLVRVRFE
jgi:hypothetical protein